MKVSVNLPMGPAPHELAKAAQQYRSSLHPGQLFDFDIASLDRVGMPIKVASFIDESGFINDGFGYGASDAEAIVGALGEMTETFHTHHALMRAPACECVSYEAMVNAFGFEAVLDPRTLALPAGLPDCSKLPLRWVRVYRWPDGLAAWAPRECIAPGGASYETRSTEILRHGDAPPARLFTPITCGLGAGTSLEQAIAHGALELLQRDGNCTSFRAMDRGIDIELDIVHDPVIKRIIGNLEQLGIRVRPKLASTEFGLVNLYVIAESDPGAETFPLMVTSCGEAVHANRERALRKALLEYLASRCRKAFMHGPLDKIRAIAPTAYNETIITAQNPANEERRALEAMVAWLRETPETLRALLADSVFASKSSVPFSSLPSVDDMAVQSPDDRLADVCRRLENESIPLYYFDASPPTAGAPRVVKCVAPGLEGETLSYLRIGKRGARRLLERGNQLVHQGTPQRGDLEVRLNNKAITELGGAVYLRASEVTRLVGKRYPLYREPSSHTAQMSMNPHQ